MIEVIEEKEDWDNYVSTHRDSDFYHTYDYHTVAKGDGKPILLKYSNGEARIALPLLIRKIPDTTFFDATSVYGYPGPLCENITVDFDSGRYAAELLGYFSDHNIISVFSRLNPFMPIQLKALEKLGHIEKKGEIVSIDLKKDIEQQRRGFGRRLKGQLNKIRRHCCTKKVTNEKEFQDFSKIYRENMDRVNAKPMYYFDDHYFSVLAKSNSFHVETLLALQKDTGRAIGAGMFIYKNSVVHYHLAGTRNCGLPLMPIKLLIDEMRIKATKLGLSHFNLGGGLAGANDSLLQFKSSFSKNMVDFYVWKLIVNPKVYQKLSDESFVSTNTKFFPLYRYNSEYNHVK